MGRHLFGQPRQASCRGRRMLDLEGEFWLEIRRLVLKEAEFGLKIYRCGVVGVRVPARGVR